MVRLYIGLTPVYVRTAATVSDWPVGLVRSWPGVRFPAGVHWWVVASQKVWLAVVWMIHVGPWMDCVVPVIAESVAMVLSWVTVRSVRSVSVLTCSWVTGFADVVVVSGSVLVTLSPVLMSLIGLVVPSARRTGVVGSKLQWLPSLVLGVRGAAGSAGSVPSAGELGAGPAPSAGAAMPSVGAPAPPLVGLGPGLAAAPAPASASAPALPARSSTAAVSSSAVTASAASKRAPSSPMTGRTDATRAIAWKAAVAPCAPMS